MENYEFLYTVVAFSNTTASGICIIYTCKDTPRYIQYIHICINIMLIRTSGITQSIAKSLISIVIEFHGRWWNDIGCWKSSLISGIRCITRSYKMRLLRCWNGPSDVSPSAIASVAQLYERQRVVRKLIMGIIHTFLGLNRYISWLMWL